MELRLFIQKLKENPTSVSFKETMGVIDANYSFLPTAFKNGNLQNKAGENSGSCKIFALGKKQNLTKEETLACFGSYYFDEVLKDAKGTDHQNIRNFMNTGFDGVAFDGETLADK